LLPLQITHLFKHVLLGGGKLVLCVNISPAAEGFNETRRVLEFSAMAKTITELQPELPVVPDVGKDAADEARCAGSPLVLMQISWQ
jgi:hypothetical protein